MPDNWLNFGLSTVFLPKSFFKEGNLFVVVVVAVVVIRGVNNTLLKHEAVVPSASFYTELKQPSPLFSVSLRVWMIHKGAITCVQLFCGFVLQKQWC